MPIRARVLRAHVLRAHIPQACAVLALLACAACSRPEPPPTDQPPEPQADTAVAAAGAGEERHTQLRDAIQRPLDKARAVEDVTLDAAERQRAEIDAQTGN